MIIIISHHTKLNSNVTTISALNLKRSPPHNSSPSLSIHVNIFKSVLTKQLLVAVTLKSKRFLLLQSAGEAAATAAAAATALK